MAFQEQRNLNETMSLLQIADPQASKYFGLMPLEASSDPYDLSYYLNAYPSPLSVHAQDYYEQLPYDATLFNPSYNENPMPNHEVHQPMQTGMYLSSYSDKTSILENAATLYPLETSLNHIEASINQAFGLPDFPQQPMYFLSSEQKQTLYEQLQSQEYTCHCGKQFQDKIELEKHAQKSHGPKSHVCAKCQVIIIN